MKTLLLLHVLLLFYSFADVASKFAAGFDMLSLGFVVCYGLVLVVLAGYALGWQQVIKRMPLTTAYANRGITVVWGIFWGAVFFSEAITPFKIIGAAMIIAGIALFSHADAEESTSQQSPASQPPFQQPPAQQAPSPQPPSQQEPPQQPPTPQPLSPQPPSQQPPAQQAPSQQSPIQQPPTSREADGNSVARGERL